MQMSWRVLPVRLVRLLSTASTPQPILMTERAANQLKKSVKAGEHMRLLSILHGIYFPTDFRILVESVGCSGFEYKLSIDDKISPDDEVIKEHGAVVVIDKVIKIYFMPNICSKF